MNTTMVGRSGIHARAPGWVLAGAVFIAAVVVLLVGYRHSVASLVWVWGHDGTYQYAYLIFPLALWLAFGLRHKLFAAAPKPSVWGLLAVALLGFAWYVGNLLDINLPQHFALVAMFPALVLACWGWRALGVLAFPLAYFVAFAVPWGDGLVGPLQDLTARFAVHALDLSGMPVLLNGREIITPSAVWMVEQACSGVKFFLACTALGCLYAYLMYLRAWKRVLFVLLAAIVPVIANGLRVYFTVMIGEHFGLQYATGTDHMIFGWQFFGTVLVILLLAGWFFRDPPRAPECAAANAGMPSRARRALWLAPIVLLVAAPLLAAQLAGPAIPAASVRLAPPTVAGWRVALANDSGWRPAFKGAAAALRVAYQAQAGAGGVELFHAVYTGKPRRGHTLVTYGNDVYDPAQARVLGTTDLQLALADHRQTGARELRLADARGARLVWYWYCVDQRCTRSSVLVKVLQAAAVLRGHTPRSSVWAVSTTVTGSGAEQARARLHAFVGALSMAGRS